MLYKITLVIATVVFFITFHVGFKIGNSYPIHIKESAMLIRMPNVIYER